MPGFGKSIGGGRRVEPREAAPVVATFFTLTRTGRSSLVDISRTGARLRGDDLPRKGEELIVTIEGMRTYGIVAWRRESECGIAFGELLPEPWLKSLRRSVRLAQGVAPELNAALNDWNIGTAR